MRLRPRLDALSLWPVLLLLAAAGVRADQLPPKERHYYIAAVEIDWNYSGNESNSGGSTFKKVVFREYDQGFQQAKAHPSWLGLLGPTLRAEEGETLVVTFRNMASGPHSVHPHGVAYGKQSEGAHYFDNTSQKEKEDDVVQPNGEHTYYWEASSKVSPQPNDPTCLTYTYISHEHFVEDFNSGLVGALLICKPGSLDESGNQVGVHHEYVFLFGVFDENQSKYKQSSYTSDNIMYTINGYAQGSLPDVNICAHSPVSLHLLGMSSQPEVFSVHINGQVLQQNGHKVSSVGLISSSTATVSMVALHTGRWLISSHTVKHMEVGMHGYVDVRKCTGFEPTRQRLTLEQRRKSTEWTYYIAAEEIIWDYAPNKHEHIDEEYKSQFLTQSATRIGSKYKKAVYTLYKNASFTEKLEPKQRKSERGILGPVIRAQIRDVIRIVFKNKASRPYSIYPHGLTIEKAQEGVNYPAGSNQSHGVPPGETHTYVWKVVDEDEPLDGDSRCLTRIYHSAVNTPRDIASGLIGPILICKSESLDVRNVQVRADKEQHAALSVFDENKSWYLDDNIRQFCDRSQVHKSEPNFYKSNVMHTINGYVYESGPLLGFCNGEVAAWHVSSIGAQDYIQTLTFYGHTFKLNERTEDILSLYPMTGESITVSMMNIGVWLLTSLYSHESAKGMRVKFQDVECFREYEYDYADGANGELKSNIGTLWNPLTLDDLKKEDEKPKPQLEKPAQVDDYTNKWAAELGLRSSKNQSRGSMEEIDLSLFDYDVVNLDTDVSPALTEEQGNNTVLSNLSSQNETNHTATENTTSTGNMSVTLASGQSSVNDTANTTVSATLSPKNNSSAETENASGYNTTEILLVGNASAQTPNIGNFTTVVSVDPRREADVEELSAEQLTRGDVFLYFPPSSNESSTVSPFSKKADKDENKTDVVVVKKQIRSLLEALTQLNNTNPSVSTSSFENVTDIQVEPFNTTGNMATATSSAESGWYSEEDITVSPTRGNKTAAGKGFSDDKPLSVVSTESPVSGKVTSSSQEFGTSDSDEDVVIYLKEHRSNPIKTTPVKLQGHNWTYEVTHQTETMEIPDSLLKYLGKETPQPVTNPKRTRKLNLRHWPEKGHGMKTKRRKEYKPQPLRGMPFSPRGFNPSFSPRGARPLSAQPISDEAELLNTPIVIGVPRPDFSDYELYVPGDGPDHLASDEQTARGEEYEYVSYKDPYSSHEDVKNFHMDENTQYFLKNSGPNARVYFIAAEEVEWDYGGYGQRRQEKTQMNSQDTKFTKVVFRRYMDSSFSVPEVRGEIDEHLGILGPVIKAEVGQSIVVVFKNAARRPYSIHPNGVSYTKQTEGLSYEDGSKYWFKYDNEVKPGDSYTYIWTIPVEVGPKPEESQCRTWVYYSGVNPERDIHSGLIGPLLVCHKGTLAKELTNWREFALLFMTFDETKSWYYEKNQDMMQRKSRGRMMGPNFKKKLMFHSINGIIYNLKGLRMYTNQLVYWHLINMGSPRDYQSVHFHGQTFLHKSTHSYRQSVFPLLPGSFATLEMYPSKPGLWLLDTEVGLNQQMGMQTLFLVLDDDCGRPLGLESGSVKDNQITANSTRGYWEPHLSRLNNQGRYNAWSTDAANSYIQVDFQRPVVISQVATQGAREMFQSQFVTQYFISYSTDRRRWIFYKGDSMDLRKVFDGNHLASETKKNTLFPPVIGRFIRLHPIRWYNMPTVRMEFYGCELDGCSVPLGIESGEIEDHRITASSTASSWYSGPWRPHLARLNRQGTINAWQAKYSDTKQWLQVELPHIKKITGIITQGAKSLGTEMYVISYSLQYSDNGEQWQHYTDDDELECKTFLGNTNNGDHVKNYIYPPIFARFIRIVPRSWMSSITMRIELLGCEFE